MKTQRALPSPNIDSSILKEKIFHDVKCFEIEDVLKAITNSQIFNNWFISSSDKQKTIFYAWIKWIDEKKHELHFESLSNLVSHLPLYHFEREYKSYNDIARSNYIITSKHIVPIKNILNKLGFKCSENTIDDSHPLFSLMQFQDEEVLWQSILNCDYSTLCFEERLALFLALRDFNGVGEAKLKEIALFKNKKGEFKPLGEMAISEKDSPSWLEQFLISANEISPNLLKYLIKEENILSQIVQPKYELFAKVSILELYSYFNEYWTLTFTKSLIDRCGTTEELLSIAEITDGAKHYLIEKHGKISLDSSLSKGSIEYRLIKLAIKSAINLDYLKSIIFIDNKNLSQYTISDDVLFNISGKEYHFSLSKILPNRFEYNVFNKVKEILSDIDGYDKLFTLSRMPNKIIKDKLTEIRSSRTPEQYAFFICYNIANNQRYNISITDTEFTTNVLSYFFEHQIDILDKYINCFINQKVVGKFINADDVTIETERLSSALRAWADNEEKEKFIIHLGAKGPLSDEIKRRKSFINNDPISLSYSVNILSEIVAFLDWAVTLHTPFYKINQVNILKEMFTRLKYFTKIDIEDYRKAKEWDNGRYIELIKNKIRIFLMNEEMPKRGIYKNVHLFTEYTGDYEYISQSGIYVNIKDKPIETVLLTVSDDSAVPFQKDDWAKLFMVSIEKLTEKENEILQKNKKIESLAESIQERDEIIRRYRAKYGDLEHDDNRIGHNNDINNETYSTTAIGPAEIIKRDVLSHDEQITAHREAEQIVRRMLESDGYNCTNWRSIESSKDNIFQEWKSVNQVRDIVTPYGENINLVIKSAKGGYIYLSATDFEFLTSNSNNVLMVWDGNTVHSVTAEDIFNKDSNVNLIFDTEYTPKHYYAALSKVFQYVKRTTFAVKNPKYNAFETIKSFGMDSKTEGVQELFDDNDL